MTCVVVIPARGGSKGLPGKNVQPVGGVPLVGWSVRAALLADSVDAVYVSTDSPEIAAVAREYGAGVIDRPPELSSDTAVTADAVRHAVDTMPEEPDRVVILQCTSPLTTAEDIDAAVELLDTADADGVVSVHEDYGFLWGRRNGDEWARCLSHGDDALACPNRQERSPLYRVNGALWVVRVTTLRTTIYPARMALYVMPAARSCDIDDARDLHTAEAKMRYDAAWCVVGSGPDAREMLAKARSRHPTARTITANSGCDLFRDRPPDVYWLTDLRACEARADKTPEMQAGGCHLVTLERKDSALAKRGLSHFDEFVPLSQHKPTVFARGEYTSVALSGLMMLQYAVNHGARSIHAVGLNGYVTGEINYFSGRKDDKREWRARDGHTQGLIAPFTQTLLDTCPAVDFTFYGKLNYPLTAANLTRVM